MGERSKCFVPTLKKIVSLQAPVILLFSCLCICCIVVVCLFVYFLINFFVASKP